MSPKFPTPTPSIFSPNAWAASYITFKLIAMSADREKNKEYIVEEIAKKILAILG